MSELARTIARVAGELRAGRRSCVSIAVQRADEVWGEGPPDALYEVASVTKVFVGTLLADFVERGEVSLDASVASLLPWASPELTMTLVQLANHTSGLPLLPDNFREHLRTRRDPFADYDQAALRAALQRARPVRRPGVRHRYTNYGFAVLGHVLAHVSGTSIEQLVRERISEPLGLRDTCFGLDPDGQRRLVGGHDVWGRPVPHWNFGAFDAAGGIHSTARDLRTFLDAQTERESALLPTFQRARRETWANRSFGVGLGWFSSRLDGEPVVWHTGASAGFASYVGFVPERRVHVVILVNHGLSLWGAFVSNPLERAAARLLRALL